MSHPARLDHHHTAQDSRLVGCDDAGHDSGLRRAREPVEFEEHHTRDGEPLADNQLAEVPILGEEGASIRLSQCQHICVGSAGERFRDLQDVMPGIWKSRYDLTRDVLVRKKSHDPMVRTASSRR